MSKLYLHVSTITSDRLEETRRLHKQKKFSEGISTRTKVSHSRFSGACESSHSQLGGEQSVAHEAQEYPHHRPRMVFLWTAASSSGPEVKTSTGTQSLPPPLSQRSARGASANTKKMASERSRILISHSDTMVTVASYQVIEYNIIRCIRAFFFVQSTFSTHVAVCRTDVTAYSF